MKLEKFRVTNFRSIKDSTWIDCDDVTNIIGINEAGKSNALLALWKLFPASGGDIDLLHDMPRSEFVTMKDNADKTVFIEAFFSIDDEQLLQKLCKLTGRDSCELLELYISRKYSGKYDYDFPQKKMTHSLKSKDLSTAIEQYKKELISITHPENEEGDFKLLAEEKIKKALEILKSMEDVDTNCLKDIKKSLDIPTIEISDESKIKQSYDKFVKYINDCIAKITMLPLNSDAVWKEIETALPRFVYYSNYGNLDSEIYLPHVIENSKRTDITGVAAAKARTLKILFSFINLKPEEILELGNEPPSNMSEEDIKKLAKKKEERTILLNSASTKLTREFTNWWKQGNYIFDLRADGKLFKIWVSDDKRPDKVALESRSTGLQWFLSFFLTFLVETKNKLQNTILLLDEAGLSLHPLAQRDLINFFKSLAKNNQIVHTTHSPFLVDTDNIDKVKIAYIDKDGYTVLSNNLRANTDPKHDTSIYAVNAALGLTVSDVLLNGCLPVIVEGVSDQYYFSAIKNYLISLGKIAPKKEIVFLPAGGVKGVSAIASIVSAKGELPYVILDSDKSGKDFKKKLVEKLYAGNIEKIIEINDVNSVVNAEVEDIMPVELIEYYVDKYFRDVEDFSFKDSLDKDKAIMPQIEKLARDNNVELPQGIKVEMAKFIKSKFSKMQSDDKLVAWEKIFNKIV